MMVAVMLDTVEIALERLRKLDKESLIAYWIEGELEEAKLYGELARRAKNLGLPDSLVETFWTLSKESREHGERLREIYRKTYGKEPKAPEIPPIEVYPVLDRFERAEDAIEALHAAMESEKLAMEVYNRLAKETEDPELRDLFESLAKVEKSHYERLEGELKLLKKLMEKKA
ncbi:Rubrerythrin-related protein (Rr) [Thermococcus gammatolerans EJ3]|uniref:Rubrerythrin-related protein (Rr) n=2 Tax=Thermococcus TaxID=2263 RepID=C5A698_THEGJ|nr:Rubrerythrin-related protein (Rr) [Thermococcus gammatolerans EJ3]